MESLRKEDIYMSYQLEITPEDGYMHVTVSGLANYENAREMWVKIAAACEAHHCYRVLGEQRMLNTMSTVDAFNHQKIFLELGITSKYRIAWVDHNPRTFETTDFIRTVLYNRDLGFGKLFSNMAQAKAWLFKDTQH
jgi:hypothetical protein